MEEFSIKYRIVETNEKEHSIVVRYYTDFLSEEDLRVDENRTPEGKPVRCRTDYNLTLWDHAVKTDEDLHAFILQAMPTAWFQLQYNAMRGLNAGKMDVVAKHAGREFEKAVKDETPAGPKSLTHEDIEKILKA